jgi:hypothetical protein
MTDRDPPDLEEVDPTAGWSERRQRHELEMEAATKRALELLAGTRHYSAGPGLEVQGRWLGFRRSRGSADLRRRKRALWEDRWR